MTTPVDDEKLGQYLHKYEYDWDLTKELVSGFSEGFYTRYSGPRVPLYFRNHLSAQKRENIVQAKIDKELRERRFAIAVIMTNLIRPENGFAREFPDKICCCASAISRLNSKTIPSFQVNRRQP